MLVDRKSTRLNSSHTVISYAVFCLKKKEHTSELQSHSDLVCRLLLEKKKKQYWTECKQKTRNRYTTKKYDVDLKHGKKPEYIVLLSMLLTSPLTYSFTFSSSLITITSLLITLILLFSIFFFFFFFNDTATTEIYTLSLHDALPFFLKEHTSDLHSHCDLVCRLLL